MYQIVNLTSADVEARLSELVALLQSTVESGASIGFHAPLSERDAEAYWTEVFDGVRRGDRVLLAALDSGRLVGSVQLALELRSNGRHRAEIQKLMVLPEARGGGLGAALMEAAESAARAAGRRLLVLDTREGDAAERLYRKLGWTEAGRIPEYTLEPDGSRHATLFFFRPIPAAP